MRFTGVYLNHGFTVSGSNEYKSPILDKCDINLEGFYYGNKTHEEGESYLENEALNGVILKSKKKPNIVIGTDLHNQLFSSTEAIKNSDVPFLGVYSACAGFIESMILASNFVDHHTFDNAVALTSSSNLASEKQFRFPVEYGAIRKCTQTFTLTGAVAAFISHSPSNIKIESATIGKVVDVGFKDVNNMGAVMAPSACETIFEHLKEMNRDASYYDVILTGDLGIYGTEILKKYIKRKYSIELNNLMDAGSMLIKTKKCIFPAGGSGPACIGLALFNEILKNGKYKKILLVGTGALFSKTTTNLKKSLSSISHAISLEVK